MVKIVFIPPGSFDADTRPPFPFRKNYIRNRLEDSELGESVIAVLDYVRQASNTEQLAEDIVRTLAMVRSSDATEEIAEAVASALAIARSQADAVEVAEAVARALTIVRVNAETVEASESVASVLDFVREQSETVEASEAVSRVIDFVRTVTSTEQVAEVVAAALVYSRTTSEAEQVAEAVSGLLGLVRSTEAVEEVSEVVASILGITRAASVDEEVSESVSALLMLLRSSSESEEVAETIASRLGLSRADIAEEEIGEAVAALLVLIRESGDTEAISEAVARALALAREVDEGEELIEVVIATLVLARVASETVTIVEAVDHVLGSPAQSVDEAVNLTEFAFVALCVADPVPTALDLKLRPRVLALIQRLGKSATFDGFDPVKVSPPELTHELLPTEVIEEGRASVLLPAQGIAFEPARGQDVAMDGASWTVLEVQPVRSGAQVAVYIVRLGGDATIPTPSTGETYLDAKLVPKVLAITERLGKSIMLGGSPTKAIPPDAAAKEFPAGDVIERGRARTYVPASGLAVDPEPGMLAVWDGETYTVEGVDPIFTGEQVALWGLRLRGGGAYSAPAGETVLDEKLVPKVLALVERLGMETVWYVEAFDVNVAHTGPLTAQSVYKRRVVTDKVRKRFKGSDVVQVGDTVAYLPGSGLAFIPYLSQRVCIDSLDYRVVRVGFIRSGEQIALYEVFLRRS